MSAETRHTPPVAIAPEHWDIVRGILRRHVPRLRVWAFGSRVAGTARQYSDLDLALITDEPISIDTLAALKEAFADSDLPWSVDIADWAGVSDRFRGIIERQRVVVQEGEAG